MLCQIQVRQSPRSWLGSSHVEIVLAFPTRRASRFCSRLCLGHKDALVMVVDSHRQGHFDIALSNYVLVEAFSNLTRCRHAFRRRRWNGFCGSCQWDFLRLCFLHISIVGNTIATGTCRCIVPPGTFRDLLMVSTIGIDRKGMCQRIHS